MVEPHGCCNLELVIWREYREYNYHVTSDGQPAALYFEKDGSQVPSSYYCIGCLQDLGSNWDNVLSHIS